MRHLKGIPKPKIGDLPTERGDPEFKDRNARIYKMHEAGYAKKYIGEVFGISGERVRQIIVMVERNMKNGYTL